MQSSKLYVGNFDHSTVDTQLEKLFSPFGQIASVAVIENKTMCRFFNKNLYTDF